VLSRARNSRGRPVNAPAAFTQPCRPTVAIQPPRGDCWVHELKHDGYRLQIHVRNGRVRLYTMNGADWTACYPRIVEEAAVWRRTRSRVPCTLASPTCHRMSAFAVAIGGKADMGCCTAYVCF
jgi:ATP dependent DNA ligase domain